MLTNGKTTTDIDPVCNMLNDELKRHTARSAWMMPDTECCSGGVSIVDWSSYLMPPSLQRTQKIDCSGTTLIQVVPDWLARVLYPSWRRPGPLTVKWRADSASFREQLHPHGKVTSDCLQLLRDSLSSGGLS